MAHRRRSHKRKSEEDKSKDERPSEHKIIKNIRINKYMILKYGPTEGCKGCLTATGIYQGNHPHNDFCRTRFIELSEEDEELKKSIDKQFEAIAKRSVEHADIEEPNTQNKKFKVSTSRNNSKSTEKRIGVKGFKRETLPLDPKT